MSNVTKMPTLRGGLVGLVAENVRMECARLGWNQSELARSIGWSPRTVNERWYGMRQWQLEDLELVSGALGVPAARFLLPRLDSNQEPTDSTSPLVARIWRAITRRGRAGGNRGADARPAASVIDIHTRQAVA